MGWCIAPRGRAGEYLFTSPGHRAGLARACGGAQCSVVVTRAPGFALRKARSANNFAPSRRPPKGEEEGDGEGEEE
eukprot:6606000-Pyramimonas_sp.AAC.1